VLVGRRSERRHIDSLLDALWHQEGSSLVISGESGIGKSALLDHAVNRAGDLNVLRGSGHPVAAHIAFSTLSELLGPLLVKDDEWSDRLPPVQRKALEGALALGPAERQDRFSVYAGTSSLLGAIAGAHPTVVIVDDWHHVDAESRDTLLFALGRLRHDALAALVATRGVEHTDVSSATGIEMWPTVRLSGLNLDDTDELVDQLCGRHAARQVLEAIHEATAGNPLAVTEATRLLTPGQLEGSEPLPSPLPVGGAPLRIYGARVKTLSAEARDALLVLSLLDNDESGLLPPALRALGTPLDSIAQLEDAGLIRAEGHHIELTHPLLRLAIVDATPAHRRRSAHRAIADAMTAPQHATQRAWHLADSVVGTDEPVAAALDAAAGSSSSIGGYTAAARAYERAAGMGAGGLKRAERLLAAADAMQMAGDTDAAASLLQAAAQATSDPRTRALADHARGRIELFAGRPHAASQLMRQAARRLGTTDRAAAAALVDAGLADVLSGRLDAAVTTVAPAIQRNVESQDQSGYVAEALTVAAKLHSGDVRDALELFDALPPPRVVADAEYVITGYLLLVWVGQPAIASMLLTEVVSGLREQNALGMLPLALYAQGYAAAFRGDFRIALPIAHEAYELAVATNNVLWQYLSAGGVALVQAHSGEESSSRLTAARALKLHESMDLVFPRDADEAVGILELTGGSPERAVQSLDLSASRQSGELSQVLDWRIGPDLVEALVRSGEVPGAHWRDQLTSLGGDTRHLAFAAAAHRSLGLCTDDDAVAHFEHAIALYDRADLRHGRARTQLLLGSVLRRQGERRAAREHLHDASETFDRLGAHLWVRQAAAELRAAGERVPRTAPTPADTLTPSEQRVASLIAGGATNKEAAMTLFLSLKTVEMHLSRVYRKLGVRSRTELARVYAGTS
jgi:DNA-binding CsgD family transcriptional regulator